MTPKIDEDLAADYRAAAEECEQMAAKSKDELVRARWLKIANDWLKLAEGAERSRG
jgi:hypothetical protein